MKKLKKKYYKEIIDFIGESPVNTTPVFLLENKSCNVFVEEAGDFEKGFLIVPKKDLKDTYLIGEMDPVKLREFLITLRGLRTLLCAEPARTRVMRTGFFRRKIKNLIYSFKEFPDCPVSFLAPPVPQLINHKHKNELFILPMDSWFLFNHFQDFDDFLEKGKAYVVFIRDHIVSCAVTSSMSEKYVDISVYTRITQRERGYSYKCSQALIKDIINMKKYPTWTTDENHKPSIRLARKLGLEIVDEIYCFY